MNCDFNWSGPCKQKIFLLLRIKELIPIVVSAALFGKAWSGHLVESKVDNIAVVHILQSAYCKEPHLMHLIRLLMLIIIFGFQLLIMQES